VSGESPIARFYNFDQAAAELRIANGELEQGFWQPLGAVCLFPWLGASASVAIYGQANAATIPGGKSLPKVFPSTGG
jgi:hypothetical protein